MPGALIMVRTSPFYAIETCEGERIVVEVSFTYLCILSYLLLQPARGAMLGQLLHAQTSPSAVGPVPVAVAMRGANDFTYAGAPGLDRKVFRMCIPRPLAFQHNLRGESVK